MKHLLFYVVLLCAVTASARLGETEKQCDRRYGTPIGSFTNTPYVCRVYCTNGFCVMVYFNSRAAVMLHVTKKDLPNADGERMSADELNALLKANSRGQPWHETDNATAALRSRGLEQDDLIQRSISYVDWVQQDGSIAYYIRQSHVLVIMSPEGLAMAMKSKKDALSGF